MSEKVIGPTGGDGFTVRLIKKVNHTFSRLGLVRLIKKVNHTFSRLGLVNGYTLQKAVLPSQIFLYFSNIQPCTCICIPDAFI